MSVKKIFTILIIVVACVVVGALVLNVLLPNVATSMVNAVEGMVYRATGLDFDWNNDGTSGSAKNNDSVVDQDTTSHDGVGVEGFSSGGSGGGGGTTPP